MAILKAEDVELDFAYYNLNGCNEIEYSFDIRLNGKPLINPEIIYKPKYDVDIEKHIISDCFPGRDWLHKFFIDILKTKKEVHGQL